MVNFDVQLPFSIDMKVSPPPSLNFSTDGGDIPVTPPYEGDYTVSPLEMEVVIPISGFKATQDIVVEAIPSNYVGSQIPRNPTPTASGPTVTIPTGYYSSQTTKSVSEGSVTAPSSISGSSATLSTGSNTITLSKTINVTPTVTAAGYITSGTAGNTEVSLTASVTTQTAQTIYPSSSDQSIASGRYLTGAQTFKGVTTTNLLAGNIKNGVVVEVGDSADSDRIIKVTGSYSGEPVVLQTKTVSYSPTESAQTDTIVAATGYDGLGEVDVSITAIPSVYVGSGIARRDDTDLSASGATVTVPSGYYEDTETKTISSGSATTPATTITANPSISVSSGGLITATASASKSVTPTISAGYVSSGTAGTVTVSGSNTSQLSTQAAKTVTPTKSSQTAVAAGKYTTGAVTVAAIPSEYIIPTGTISITSNGTGIDVSGYATANVSVSGHTPVYQTVTKSYTPTESQQTETITAGTGYDAIEEVDITVSAISSTYVGSGITQRSSSSLSASGATVTAPAGYYASNATKSVASGTVTAPSSISGTSASVSTGTNTLTLTKTVSVTPNVTSAGYISTGTAGNASVSLTASVTTKAAATITPGTTNQTIAAGTYLTGIQTISGDANLVSSNIISGTSIFGVPGSVVLQNVYTGSGTPSSSLGSNGDIYIQN